MYITTYTANISTCFLKPADIREHLQMFSYVREAIKTTLRLLKEGDSISDIPEFEPLFLCEEEKQCEY